MSVPMWALTSALVLGLAAAAQPAWALPDLGSLTAPAPASNAAASPAPNPAPIEASDKPLLALIERLEAAARGDPQQLIKLSDEALARLAIKPDPDLEMRARLQRCDYFNERDAAAAQRELQLMHDLLPRLRQPGLRAGMLGCDGELHENSGDNIQAMALYEQAVAVASAAGDDEHMANSLYLRGYLRGVMGDFALGLADLQRALALFERLKKPAHASTVVNGVAILYNRMGDVDQARQYFERALQGQGEPGMVRERVVTLHNLGRAYERLGRWDDAQRAFEGVLGQSRELNYARGEVYALRGLAAVRNAQADPARALAMVAEGMQRFAGAPDERLRAQLLLQRGVALRLLHRLPDAQASLRDALAIFKGGDSGAEEGQTRDELAQLLAEQGDWRQAFEQQGLARSASETLLRRQIDQRFAAMKVQFDTATKDRENALLQRENRAGELALAGERRASTLQRVAVGLASALALLLGALAWRHRRTSERMRNLAMTDELTGLPNRREALRVLQTALDTGQPTGALLIVDLDLFKPINDEHGHLVGDEILRAVTASWRPLVRHGMALGRMGGEEFMVLVREHTAEAASAQAEQLRATVAALDVSAWLPDRRVTVSVGVTLLRGGDTLSLVLSRADKALYHAKAGGRNRVALA